MGTRRRIMLNSEDDGADVVGDAWSIMDGSGRSGSDANYILAESYQIRDESGKVMDVVSAVSVNASDDVWDIDWGKSGLIPGKGWVVPVNAPDDWKDIWKEPIEQWTDAWSDVSKQEVIGEWKQGEGWVVPVVSIAGPVGGPENASDEDILPSLHSCKNCGEKVTRYGPETWHTISTLIRCAGNGVDRAEV
jgi:hypothetical protein